MNTSNIILQYDLSNTTSLVVYDQLGSGDSKLIVNILPTELVFNSFELILQENVFETMYHLGNEVPRLVKVQGTITNNQIEPVYRHPVDAQPQLIPWTATVDKIRLYLQEYLHQELNHALIQYYRDGKDFIGEHSDKTLDIVNDSYIVNLSLYSAKNTCKQPRIMKLKNKQKNANGIRPTQQIPLPHNSLFCLGWQTNRQYLHAIGKASESIQQHQTLERISLTFRCIGTWLCKAEGKLWGQGAKYKTIDDCKQDDGATTKEEMEKEYQEMIIAFGNENRQVDFDWQQHYGQGFTIVDSQSLNPTTTTSNAQ